MYCSPSWRKKRLAALERSALVRIIPRRTYNALITAYGKACNLPAVRIIPFPRVPRFSLLSYSLCSLTMERVVSFTRGVPFLFPSQKLVET